MAQAYLVLVLATAFACGASTPAPVAPETKAQVAAAESHERARRYDRARAGYERARRQAPDPRSRAWAGRKLADALVAWGEYHAAEHALEALLEITPGDASAWHDLGVLRHRRGDASGAETALRRAVEHAPSDPRPRVALAALLVNQRRFGEALAEYERLLELDLPQRTRTAVHEAMRLVRAEMSPP